MSRKSNVNPNHYKTAGRERQGEDVLQELHKQKYAQAKKGRKRRRGQGENLIAPKPAKVSGKGTKK